VLDEELLHLAAAPAARTKYFGVLAGQDDERLVEALGSAAEVCQRIGDAEQQRLRRRRELV
jgi:hypothetical protein